ncbi:MAG TPA: LysM peptidoglycan-binding domain-containing protein [Tepidisphaeraceae bacterium]|nr:LysM peptidoglycan-binding domain-containing protein [Tepidisphaeraceae bacterium]
MRKMIVGGALTVAVAAGCQPQNKQDLNASASAVRPAALNVSAEPAGTPMYRPAPVRAVAVVPPAEPAVTQTPVLDAPTKIAAEKPAAKRWAKPTTFAKATHSSKAKAAVASGDSYKVKKGDTLYAIAKAQYGDGKKWERITAANPGLTPGTLRAGQTLTIPQ